MSEFIEFVGKTTAEALQKAQTHFHLALNRLEVEVVSAGSSGLFGLLGAKKAKVRVRPLAGGGLEAEMAELAAVVSDGQTPRGARRPSAPAAPELPMAVTRAANVATPSPAPPVPELPGPAPVAELPAPAAIKAAPAVSPASSPALAEETPPPPAMAQPEAPLPRFPEAGEEEADLQLDDAAEDEEAPDPRLEEDPQVLSLAQEVLLRLLEPLDASAQVTAQCGAQGIELAVQAPEVGVLIGRRGQNLEALQYIVTRIVSHRYGRPVRIVVDAGEYRRRRREALEDLARRMAHKARQSGRAVALGPLSAPERRVVHMTLKGDAGLTTSSRGRGELKKVVISPR